MTRLSRAGGRGICALRGVGLYDPVARRQPRRIFWGLVTLAMLFLGVNKELDLQWMLTAAGRCLSQLHGWYEERRLFQRDFIIGLLVTAGLPLPWFSG